MRHRRSSSERCSRRSCNLTPERATDEWHLRFDVVTLVTCESGDPTYWETHHSARRRHRVRSRVTCMRTPANPAYNPYWPLKKRAVANRAAATESPRATLAHATAVPTASR